MKNNEFKNFKEIAIKEGINATAWMGFAWINLTERQHKLMSNIAKSQGLKENKEGYFELANGMQIKSC